MNNKYKLAVATLLSLIGLYIAFNDVDPKKLFYELKIVDFKLVITATILLLLSCVIRAYRWKLLIDSAENIKLSKVFSATMVGYFGNGIFAFRLGELLKAYTVSRDQKIDTLEAFGTVIIERMLDVVMVLLIFTILVPRLPFDDQYIKMGVFTFLGISLLTIIILMVAVKYQWLIRLDTLSLFSSDLGKRFLSYTTKLENGIKSLRRIKRPWEVILSSILIWGIYFLETLILIKSCKLPLNAYDAGIILFLGSISFGIPALPGSAGTYDASIKYVLMIMYGIASEEALNYAIVSHAVAYFPLTIIGFIFFLNGSYDLNELRRVRANSA